MIGPQVMSSWRSWTIISPPRMRSPSTSEAFLVGHVKLKGDLALAIAASDGSQQLIQLAAIRSPTSRSLSFCIIGLSHGSMLGRRLSFPSLDLILSAECSDEHHHHHRNLILYKYQINRNSYNILFSHFYMLMYKLKSIYRRCRCRTGCYRPQAIVWPFLY